MTAIPDSALSYLVPCLIVVLGCGSLAAQQISLTQTYIPNPQMTEGTTTVTGWSLYNVQPKNGLVMVRDTGFVASPPASLRLDSVGGPVTGYGTLTLKGVPRETLRFRAMARCQGHWTSAKVVVQGLDASWAGREWIEIADLAPSDGWQPIQGEVHFAATTTHATIQIALKGEGSFWLDDLSLEPIDSHRPAITSHARLLAPQQEIKGWGDMLPIREHWDNSPFNILDHPKVVDAFYRMGCTFLRVAMRVWEMPAVEQGVRPDGTPAWDSMVKALHIARDHGIRQYILTCWSPPAAWKTNNASQGYIDANHNGRRDADEPIGRLKPAYEDAFVARYAACVKALIADGFDAPLGIDVQNEPDCVVTYEACIYTPEQLARVTEKLRHALDAVGLPEVQVQGPDCNYYSALYLDGESRTQPGYFGGEGFPTLARDPAYLKALGSYAFHAYGQWGVRMVGAGVRKFPKDVWMTESSDCGGDGDMGWAMCWTRKFISDLVDVPSNYWAHFINIQNNAGPVGKWALISGDRTPILSKRYQVFRRLWNTVRPGWHVQPMSTDDPDLRTDGTNQGGYVQVDLVGFISPMAHHSVVLIANHGGPRNLIIGGLEGTHASIRRTSVHEDDALVAAVPVTAGVAMIPCTDESVTIVTTGP